jgi:endonuclease VIII
MPEGDTVRRTATRLHQALAGRRLVRAELRWPDLGHIDLAGRDVTEVTAYGKHILTRISGEEPLTLHSHLRMDGSWRMHATGSEAWPSPDRHTVRAILANDEWTAVGIRLGELDLMPTSTEQNFLSHLGPDILAADFADPATNWGEGEALRRIQEKPREPIAAALLDQRNLAGIGTFYASEALFALGVSPWTPVADVPDLAKLVDRARRMLTANLDRATPTTTGDLRPGNRQWVHARSGLPCRRCHTPVRVASVEVYHRSPGQTVGLERTMFYCPSCQQGPTPTDDGRAQAPLGTKGRAGNYR